MAIFQDVLILKEILLDFLQSLIWGMWQHFYDCLEVHIYLNAIVYGLDSQAIVSERSFLYDARKLVSITIHLSSTVVWISHLFVLHLIWNLMRNRFFSRSCFRKNARGTQVAYIRGKVLPSSSGRKHIPFLRKDSSPQEC